MQAWAQQDFSRWQIGANFSPDFAYRTTEKSFGYNEIGKFGFTTGLNVVYNFSNLFGLETGILFSDKGYQTKETTVLMIDYTRDFSGYATSRGISSYRYIDIPLKANFTFGKHKLRYVGTVGLTANILINGKFTYYSDVFGNGVRITRDKYFSKFNVSPMIGFGIDYQFAKNFNLKIVPTFRYGVIKIWNESYSVPYYLWNAGIDIGIYYGIK
jgi:hypothetical protein